MGVGVCGLERNKMCVWCLSEGMKMVKEGGVGVGQTYMKEVEGLFGFF